MLLGIVVLIMTGVAGWLIGYLRFRRGPWYRIQKSYQCATAVTGTTWPAQTIWFGIIRSYNFCVRVTVNDEGIGLALPILPLTYRWGQQPLFIPWTEVSVTREPRSLFVNRVRLTFAREPSQPIILEMGLARKIQAALGKDWFSGDADPLLGGRSGSIGLGTAVKGLLGIALFLFSFPLLWSNENRAVQASLGMSALGATLATVPVDKVDPTNDQRAVHMTGEATTDEILTDPQFTISVKAMKLRRNVEMFQWREDHVTISANRGTPTVEKYSYAQAWFDRCLNSNGYNRRAGHINPAAMRFSPAEQTARRVELGAFQLSAGLVSQLNDHAVQPLPLIPADLDKLPATLKPEARIEANVLYLPETPKSPQPDPAHPKTGDLRISFVAVKPVVVSIVARQLGDSFAPWQSRSGIQIERLTIGAASAASMTGNMEQANAMSRWLGRGVGVVLMGCGVALFYRPFVSLAGGLPILGDLLGAGGAAFSLTVAVSLSLLTIAAVWLGYQPVVGVGLIIFAAAIAIGLQQFGARRRLNLLSGVNDQGADLGTY
jgi:hypothetical protein